MEEQNIGTKKLDKNKKIILTIIAVLILCVGSTLAYIIASLQDEARGNASVTSDAVDILRFEIDKDISLNPTQFNVVEGGDNLSDTAVGSAILRANSTNDNATYNYYVYFQINSNDYVYTTDAQTPEIVLTITNPEGSPVTSIEGLDYVTSGGVSGFDITTKSGLYNVAELYEIISNSSTQDTIQEWEFTVSFINLDTNQYENGGKTLEAEVILSREPRYTLANYIIENVYAEDGVNGLYYHDGQGSYENAELEAGDDSYRYSGANPNNYVCFGTDENPCPVDNLYRIIGVFGDNVKLIKYDYADSNLLGTDGDYYGNYLFDDSSLYRGQHNFAQLATYYWNNSDGMNYSSDDWADSRLNTVNLNTNFINSLGHKWMETIYDNNWILSKVTVVVNTENNAHDVFVDEFDNNEDIYTSKVGLMYISDYLYGFDSNYWSNNYIDAGDVIDDLADNWLFMGLAEYVLTIDDGNIHPQGVAIYIHWEGIWANMPVSNFGLAVRPTFYLNSNVVYSSGDGSIDNPYRIEI